MKTTAVYRWREGFHPLVEASAVGPYVDRLLEKYADGLKPSHVLQEAKAQPGTPLHACFEWDDAKAAHRHRITQASTLVRALVVTRSGLLSDEPKRVALSVRSSDTGPRVFMSTDVVMNDETLRRRFIEQAGRDLSSWRKQYGELKELHRLFSMVETQLQRLAA